MYCTIKIINGLYVLEFFFNLDFFILSIKLEKDIAVFTMSQNFKFIINFVDTLSTYHALNLLTQSYRKQNCELMSVQHCMANQKCFISVEFKYIHF